MGGVVVLAFVAAPLVDIDHPIAWLLGIPDQRFLLPYFNVASYWFTGCGTVLAIACLCRFTYVRFLRKNDKKIEIMTTTPSIIENNSLDDFI
jgi:hypothetical protein